jgi:hypothetical protein
MYTHVTRDQFEIKKEGAVIHKPTAAEFIPSSGRLDYHLDRRYRAGVAQR